ncbi:metal-dependent transcriptional regulator [Natronococcus occultus]|uniref:Mn-dependent transcriptional regulator n=1 Tax=Natronococcus occultus SP4 TaxID=694430 RepID=L0K3Q4_9EURY|nr:Mn-dependent transcriptional regulator [Natronococcus occultus SP4]
MEDYSKAIYHLQQETDDEVRTSEIADHLDVTAPTVSNMLDKLEDQELINREKYKGVSLTLDGEQVALEVIRNHRLLESYLTEHLDYSWADVHDEADRLEHHISDELAARVAATLNDPETDPHGAPIPNSTLELPDKHVESVLSEFEEEAMIVEQVSDRDPEVLEYLSEHGIDLGTELVIRKVTPFGLYTLEPVEGGESVSLPEYVAQSVRVASVELAYIQH